MNKSGAHQVLLSPSKTLPHTLRSIKRGCARSVDSDSRKQDASSTGGNRLLMDIAFGLQR